MGPGSRGSAPKKKPLPSYKDKVFYKYKKAQEARMGPKEHMSQDLNTELIDLVAVAPKSPSYSLTPEVTLLKFITHKTQTSSMSELTDWRIVSKI